jgi:signal peptidase I
VVTLKATSVAVLAAAAAVSAAAQGRRRYTLVTVRGCSMEPTYRDGEQVLVRRRSPRLRIARGDVAVFRNPPHEDADGPPEPAWLVKRIIAVPGDDLPRGISVDSALHGATLPAGFVVVRGDNARSRDSRHFGLVAASDILGTVVSSWINQTGQHQPR